MSLPFGLLCSACFLFYSSRPPQVLCRNIGLFINTLTPKPKNSCTKSWTRISLPVTRLLWSFILAFHHYVLFAGKRGERIRHRQNDSCTEREAGRVVHPNQHLSKRVQQKTDCTGKVFSNCIFVNVGYVLQVQLMMLSQARHYAFVNLSRPNIAWMKSARKGAESQVTKSTMFCFTNL